MIKKIDIKIIHLFCVVRKESKVEFFLMAFMFFIIYTGSFSQALGDNQ